MKTKIFLSLIAAGAFCVVAPAQAQQTAAEKTAAGGATKKPAVNEKQGAATTKTSSDKSGKAASNAGGAQQNVEVVIGSTGLSPSKINLSAGNVVIGVKNASDKPHKVVLQGGTLKKSDVSLKINATGTMQAALTPGTYTVSCGTSGHNESSAKLIVQ
jgi:plastocyanin